MGLLLEFVSARLLNPASRSVMRPGINSVVLNHAGFHATAKCMICMGEGLDRIQPYDHCHPIVDKWKTLRSRC